MKVAIDTNRYRDFCSNVPEVVRVLQKAERVYVPFGSVSQSPACVPAVR